MLMDSNQALADRLATYISAYKFYVETKKKARLLDIATFAESLARDLAKIVFGYEDLVNLNLGMNFPAVDLGSVQGKCAIQVTITASSDKIIDTQRKFFHHGLDGKYSQMKFIILGGKKKTYKSTQFIRERGNFRFDPCKDIYDLDDLFKILVDAADPVKYETFCERLKRELDSGIQPYLLGADQPGQHLRRLLEAHDVRTGDAVQALARFGISRTTYSNITSLSEAASKDLIQYVAGQFGVSDDWLDGTDTHIYSGAPGSERTSSWRRDLTGAYDLVERTISKGERLGLIIPTGFSLKGADADEDTVDWQMDNYENFFLVAQKKNDFSTESFRMVISDPLTYQPCRDGIFLLFVAAEIYEIETQMKTYIDVYEVPREHMQSCSMGDMFLIDLVRSGHVIDNHKDFFYSDGRAQLKATVDVPLRIAPFLQSSLTEFVARRSLSLPISIVFP